MKFTLKASFNTTAKEIYTAWLDSELHSKMTGGEAVVSDKVGGNFTAWEGYIEGENTNLTPFSRIVQSWRTTQFEAHEEDSQIEILLNEIDNQTELTLIHSNLPKSGEHYKDGWENHYFNPMRAYFG